MKKKYDGVCVKVYFNPSTFVEIAQLAEKAGKRRVGLPPYIQKKHGFLDEKVANTDGIARFLKMTAIYWSEHRKDLEEQAIRVKKEQERLRNYGIIK